MVRYPEAVGQYNICLTKSINELKAVAYTVYTHTHNDTCMIILAAIWYNYKI
jgi:hypothetical protein